MDGAGAARLVVQADRRLAEHLRRLASQRMILPTETLSVHDFAVPPADLVPTDAEAEEFVRQVERRYADPTALQRVIARWWDV